MQKQVLIIEDNPMDQLIQKTMLENTGAEVTISSNGLDAVEMLGYKNFDLILLDLGLPSLGGMQFLLGLKTASFPCDIPIIVISGNLNADQIKMAKFLGVDECLKKPMTEAHRVEVIEQYLNPEEV